MNGKTGLNRLDSSRIGYVRSIRKKSENGSLKEGQGKQEQEEGTKRRATDRQGKEIQGKSQTQDRQRKKIHKKTADRRTVKEAPIFSVCVFRGGAHTLLL